MSLHARLLVGIIMIVFSVVSFLYEDKLWKRLKLPIASYDNQEFRTFRIKYGAVFLFVLGILILFNFFGLLN